MIIMHFFGYHPSPYKYGQFVDIFHVKFYSLNEFFKNSYEWAGSKICFRLQQIIMKI